MRKQQTIGVNERVKYKSIGTHSFLQFSKPAGVVAAKNMNFITVPNPFLSQIDGILAAAARQRGVKICGNDDSPRNHGLLDVRKAVVLLVEVVLIVRSKGPIAEFT